MEHFIDPTTLARVKDLPLVAKTLAQGFLHGLHSSTQKGTGVEFSQYRSYEPGDAMSRIDWKLFARSDKYFVREAQRESDINVYLVLDASNSMNQMSQSTATKGAWNKLDYARYLLATVAYLAQQQGDAVGLLGLSSSQIDFLPAMAGQHHWQKLMLQLARMHSGGVFPDASTIQSQIAKVRSQGLIFVVSDFYQQQGEVLELLGQLRSHKTDVVAVQLESDDEVYFPFKGQVRFEDLESAEQRLVNANAAKQAYMHARQEFNQKLELALKRNKINLLRANIDQPLDQLLFDFLSARAKVG